MNRFNRKIPWPWLGSLALIFSLFSPATVFASVQNDLVGPPGSGSFGAKVYTLPNGNLVVTDPTYTAGDQAEAGAVHLYHGFTLVKLATLTGGTAGDKVGSARVNVLPDGNYVVVSPDWSHNGAAQAGAVTWCSGNFGCNGPVSAANSLVGSQDGDKVGGDGWNSIWSLPGGNYVVVSVDWANGSATKAGAVTWCSKNGGCSGPVGPDNSLVGTQTDDWVGYGITFFNQLITLSNGNYLVNSPYWAGTRGALTFCLGASGCRGPVSTANSLVGTQVNEFIGGGGTDNGAVPLPNGNYLAPNPYWTNGGAVNVGAVTYCSGTSGCVGTISAANSLVGSQTEDQVGWVVTVLTNGNYVVSTRGWDNGAIVDVGAVTWCSGSAGCSGPVSAANSLVGSTPYDAVGWGYIKALPNGNYVVQAPYWDKGGVVDAGAVVWCNGTSGCTPGPVNAADSLTGSQDGDLVGRSNYLKEGVHLLTNGHYVVCSGTWKNGGTPEAGAVTWCDGTTGCKNTVVSAVNSLVGSQSYDRVGNFGVTALANGNYVVSSLEWKNGAINDAGAATWCSSAGGCIGPVSSANSLVGNASNEFFDFYLHVEALPNGNYVVRNPCWKNGSLAGAGAVTWCSGTAGCTGVATADNSLVGSQAGDRVGAGDSMVVGGGLSALDDGNFVVHNNLWANGGVIRAGAATWCSGTAGCSGPVSVANSLVGATTDDGQGMWTYGLPQGGYVVKISNWSNGSTAHAGAVAWCGGSTPCVGPVTPSNSLVGAVAGDQMGGGGVIVLSNGDYVIKTPSLDNEGTADAGGITRGDGKNGTVGLPTVDNTVRGTAASGGAAMNFAYDEARDRLVVGRPADNRVTVFFSVYRIYLPLVES